jgi:hypothetical protein
VNNNSLPPLITRRKVIPVIIDFFVSPSSLSRFCENYKEYDLVLISNLDAYNYLKKEQTPFKVAHFPLSLSDKYELKENTHFEKKYNLLLAGRTNPVLNGFLKQYVAKHPDFEYIFRKEENNHFVYYSNKTGFIGDFSTRKEFQELLRASKCAFYSTPGIDGDESRTNGFSPVTPRFLEFLAANCLVIARYPDNADTTYYELPSITPSIENYEAFEKIVDQYIQSEEIADEYVFYLKKHYTSERVKLLKNIMNTI